jgi:hypothetical protein
MQIQLLWTEKRKFNWVMLGLLAITIAAWGLYAVQSGTLSPLQ